MASVGSATCARCGASFAGGVARCPFCGASVAAHPEAPGAETRAGEVVEASAIAPPLVPRPDRVSVRARPRPLVNKQPNWVLSASAAGILGAGVVAILLLGRHEAPPSAPVAAFVP